MMTTDRYKVALWAFRVITLVELSSTEVDGGILWEVLRGESKNKSPKPRRWL